MGLFRSTSMMGWLAGTLLGGFGCDYYGWLPTLVTFGICSMAAVLFGIWSQKDVQHARPSPVAAAAVPVNFKLMWCGFTMGIVHFRLPTYLI